MDIQFYLGAVLLLIGLFAGAILVSFKIGKRKGAKEYYDLLTTDREESEIQ